MKRRGCRSNCPEQCQVSSTLVRKLAVCQPPDRRHILRSRISPQERSYVGRQRGLCGKLEKLVRDKRFIAAHRGGPLELDQHRALMAWARKCVEHILPLMPDPMDPRLPDAISVSHQWEAGEARTGVAQKASAAAHAAARGYSNRVSVAVARSIAQAVATAHFADHCLGAALYSLKAASLSGGSVDDERAWQDAQLSADIRELVLENRNVRKGPEFPGQTFRAPRQ